MNARIAFSPSKIAAAALFSAVLAAGTIGLPAQAAPADDAQIAAQVQAALAKPWQLEGSELKVVVSQGQVHLAGWAQRPEDVALAREIASEVRGVQRVDSFVRTWSSEDR